MRMNKSMMAAIGASLAVTACAGTPDMTISYKLPKTTGQITASQIISCDVENNQIVVSNVATDFNYVASTDPKDRWAVNVRDLDGPLSNLEAEFNFHADGRLKGVNSTTTGEAAEYLKTAISIAKSAVVPFAFDLDGSKSGDAEVESKAELSFCDYINHNAKNKDGSPVRSKSLIFNSAIHLDKLLAGDEVRFINDGRTQDILSAIEGKDFPDGLGMVTATLVRKTAPDAGLTGCVTPVCIEEDQDSVLLKLRAPLEADVEVKFAVVRASGDASSNMVLPVQLMQEGTDYFVPMPRSAFFGKSSFELALNEAGVPTKIGFGKETGAAQPLGVGKAALDAFAAPTSSDKANALKAESELIIQRQRLLRCQAEPATCS